MTDKTAQVIHAVEVTQHSCFVFKQDEVVVTVYSPSCETLTKADINFYLDCAKDALLHRVKS